MRKLNLRSVDLNLLLALEALLEEKSVTGAAKRTFLSQPAMSRALAKLREIFGDQLLVKSGRSMLLTPRAQVLRDELPALLKSVRGFIYAEEFVPEQAKGSVDISCFDAMAVTFLSKIFSLLAQRSPQVKYALHAPQNNDNELLVQGHRDILLTSSRPPVDLLFDRLLIDNRLCFLVRSDHPIHKQTVSMDTILSYGHVVESRQSVDLGAHWDNLGSRRRQIALEVDSLISAAALVQETDWVVTVPLVFAHTAVEMFDLVQLDIPKGVEQANVESLALYMVWHQRCESDPLHNWVRGAIKSYLSEWNFP